MAGEVRVAITLACEECKRCNYQTNKSRRNNPDRGWAATAFRSIPSISPSRLASTTSIGDLRESPALKIIDPTRRSTTERWSRGRRLSSISATSPGPTRRQRGCPDLRGTSWRLSTRRAVAGVVRRRPGRAARDETTQHSTPRRRRRRHGPPHRRVSGRVMALAVERARYGDPDRRGFVLPADRGRRPVRGGGPSHLGVD